MHLFLTKIFHRPASCIPIDANWPTASYYFVDLEDLDVLHFVSFIVGKQYKSYDFFLTNAVHRIDNNILCLRLHILKKKNVLSENHEILCTVHEYKKVKWLILSKNRTILSRGYIYLKLTNKH